jgi:opacity protein-like surface antigen
MRRALALALVALALAPSAAAAAVVSSAQATAVATRLTLVKRLERTHPGAFSQVSNPIAGQWQVAFYSHNQEFVQVLVSASSGRVLGTYTGIQIARISRRLRPPPRRALHLAAAVPAVPGTVL